MRSNVFAAILFLEAIFLAVGTSGKVSCARDQIEQSDIVRVELNPTFPVSKRRSECAASFTEDLSTQINQWVAAAMEQCLGHSTASPDLALTANGNEERFVRRGLKPDEKHRAMLFNCNTCHSYACKVWCGCRLCANDDDSRRLLPSFEGFSEERFHREVSKYVQEQSQMWLEVNDVSECMGQASALKALVHFY